MHAPSSLLLLLCLCAAPAAAQKVNRCTGADGATVFSDRRCEDLGAIDRLPPRTAPSTASEGASGLYRPQCVRRLSELAQQIRTAVDARDVNRLSTLYWWNGVSDEAAQRILDRLDAITQRPLVAIVPVLPNLSAQAAYPAATRAASGALQRTPDAAAATPKTSTGTAPGDNASPPRARATALRLEQTLGSSATPTSTVLSLRRQYNCFWISF
ncbi:DUF4124 domain-containing protein [Xanthomonas graminis]|jgi:hypothetical protein|uniref:DUF4124 domain-containing protein n=1 Tax=Xanthomonas graminis pv. graminis TaxID=134874 RepID=A0A1M4IBV8_9XANT|nr:DUF4124 domain-containing protein [Xanthomonas translucens]OAX62654.1 hypothetical protein A6R72_08890 [Xanthomonas translucens pv. graminis]UKE53867.1 DUF4124 domain-containing protein [Xanthomonas translucens pv. graminis]WIH08184.1 DUF4124 domain-containing protein [Xanthomonas translucens pv. graminis]WIH13063.1 DUF4124 domain-containing protein [Xanthomonas translucens pv. graminis]WIH16659.1 DUF4124 domain-containing protein [Xanthomonas translucens pv. graminis]